MSNQARRVKDETAERPDLERVHGSLEAQEYVELGRYLESYHPSDLADLLESLHKDERAEVLKCLPDELASETLAEMEEIAHPEDLLVADPERVAELVRELSVDDAADIIGELPTEKQHEVLGRLTRTEAGELRELLSYDEESAGGVMTTEIVAVPESATVVEAVEEIKKQVVDVEDFYSVFVVDDEGALTGTVSIQNLIVQPPDKPICEITEPSMAVVPVNMDQEEVARLMSRYNLVAVPVVDSVGRLIGRVTFDDIMDIIEAETTEDILRFAGGDPEEHPAGSARAAIKLRLPWLFLNLITAFFAASVIYFFQSTLERALLLAVFMPVIAGMGGNAGIQALAVTVRRLALSAERGGAWKLVRKEMGVGLANGAAVGVVAGAIGYVVGGDMILGVIVTVAMWFNLIIAGFAGAFVPVFLESRGVDPAVASSIFVTTLTDVCGFFLLLGLAAWILI